VNHGSQLPKFNVMPYNHTNADQEVSGQLRLASACALHLYSNMAHAGGVSCTVDEFCAAERGSAVASLCSVVEVWNMCSGGVVT